jgi:hypothetical protein
MGNNSGSAPIGLRHERNEGEVRQPPDSERKLDVFERPTRRWLPRRDDPCDLQAAGKGRKLTRNGKPQVL